MPKILFPIGTKVPNSHLFDDHKIDAFSKKAESDIIYVNIAGGTMTGPLTVSQGKSIYLKQNIDNNYGEITYIDKNNNELLSLSYFDNDLGIKSSSNNFHKIWHTGNFNKDNYITKEDANKFLNIHDLEDNVQSITGYMFQGNNESGIISNYNEQTKKIDFTTNNPTITLAGGVTGSAKMTNLSDVIINATVVNDSHNHDLRYKSFMKISDGVNEINANKFNDELILSESDGLSLSLDVDNKKIIFAHGKTSTQQSSINNGRTYIQSVELDKFGHIIDITTSDVESITWDNIIEKPDAFIPILGETLSTAYRGDRGKIAYDHSQSEHASVNAWVYDEDTIKSVKVNSAKNADTVNGKTVAVNVPSGAKFTDTIYTHPTSPGYKHIPSGGSSGQVLKYSSDGTAIWATEKDTITTINGKTGAISKADIVALGIPAQDTVYSLPTASSSVLGGIKVGSRLSISNGVLSADSQTDNNFTNALKTKLDGIATGANNYTHPSSHPASMITGLHASATTGVAGSVAWGNVTGKPSTFAPATHTHSNISITAGTGLSGGGALSATRTLSIASTYAPNTSTSLGASKNLNDYRTAGFYHQTANANATIALNYPVARAGALLVEVAAGVIQTYKVYNSSDVYVRGYYGTTWTAWRKLVNDGDSIPWASISGAPATATTHPTWAQVTGKPSTFSPAAHNHSGTNITSGTIPIARLPVATKAQAEAGTSNSYVMSPLRVKEALAGLGLGAQIVEFTYIGTGTGVKESINVGIEAKLLFIWRDEIVTVSETKMVLGIYSRSRRLIITQNKGKLEGGHSDNSSGFSGTTVRPSPQGMNTLNVPYRGIAIG